MRIACVFTVKPYNFTHTQLPADSIARPSPPPSLCCLARPALTHAKVLRHVPK